MSETVLSTEMTDEQYEAEANRLLAEMRAMNKEIRRLDEEFEDSKASSRQYLQEAQELLRQMKAR